MRFTDRQVENLKPRLERFEIWEARGLGLRISPSGRKSWVFMYRYHGRPRRMTIGTYPEVSVAEAHKRHGAALADIEKGIDPGAVVVAHRREERQAETIEDLVEDFIKLYARPNKKSWRGDEWMLHREVVPRWGKRKAREITRRDVIRLLDTIAIERGTPVLANRVLAVVRRMFSWGVSRDVISATPCAHIERPAMESPRTRVLIDARRGDWSEVTKLWEALQAAPDTDRAHFIVELILRLGQRPGEVSGARWDEIDLGAGVWVIPGSRTKNGRDHVVPIVPAVKAVFERAATLSRGSPWVIPSTRSRHPLRDPAAREWIAQFCSTSGATPFRPHDLRRTCATGLTLLRVPQFIVGRLLNHSTRTITDVYDQNDYQTEIREALGRWNAKLEKLAEQAQ